MRKILLTISLLITIFNVSIAQQQKPDKTPAKQKAVTKSTEEVIAAKKLAARKKAPVVEASPIISPTGERKEIETVQ